MPPVRKAQARGFCFVEDLGLLVQTSGELRQMGVVSVSTKPQRAKKVIHMLKLLGAHSARHYSEQIYIFLFWGR